MRLWAHALSLPVMMKTAALLGAVLLLGGCGGRDDGDPASSPAVTTETTIAERSATSATGNGDSTETTVVPVGTYTEAERQKVRGIYKAYVAEYGDVIKLADPDGMSLDDAHIDKQIVDSCTTKAKGFKATDHDVGVVMMLFGAKLEELGKDVATFLEDSFEASVNIADVVGC
jgi:hypothetical protein